MTDIQIGGLIDNFMLDYYAIRLSLIEARVKSMAEQQCLPPLTPECEQALRTIGNAMARLHARIEGEPPQTSS